LHEYRLNGKKVSKKKHDQVVDTIVAKYGKSPDSTSQQLFSVPYGLGRGVRALDVQAVFGKGRLTPSERAITAAILAFVRAGETGPKSGDAAILPFIMHYCLVNGLSYTLHSMVASGHKKRAWKLVLEVAK
jgi:hypothetical protein